MYSFVVQASYLRNTYICTYKPTNTNIHIVHTYINIYKFFNSIPYDAQNKQEEIKQQDDGSTTSNTTDSSATNNTTSKDTGGIPFKEKLSDAYNFIAENFHLAYAGSAYIHLYT